MPARFVPSRSVRFSSSDRVTSIPISLGTSCRRADATKSLERPGSNSLELWRADRVGGEKLCPKFWDTRHRGGVVPPKPKRPDDLVEIELPSGGRFTLYRLEESHVRERVERYTADHHFTSVSDLQELDRIVILELMVWRNGTWLSRQTDYWGQAVDERELNRALKDHSTELRQIKAALGIDKITRDKLRGEDSLSHYLDNLKMRAKEFGIVRERQLDAALELFNDLKARVILFDNTTSDEQEELNAGALDILSWVRDVAIPRYHAIDAHFPDTSHRLWNR